MTPEMQKIRNELASDYANGDVFQRVDFNAGFDACYKLMQEREKVLVEALEYYADNKSWFNDTIDKDAGNIAREALSKIRGEK